MLNSLYIIMIVFLVWTFLYIIYVLRLRTLVFLKFNGYFGFNYRVGVRVLNVSEGLCIVIVSCVRHACIFILNVVD